MRIKKQANPEGRLWRDRVDRCGRRRDQQRARKSSVEPPEATPLLLRSFDVLPWQHDVPHQHERTFWALYVTGGRRTQQMHSHSHMRTHSTNSWSLLQTFFLFFFWGVGVLKGEWRTDLLVKSQFCLLYQTWLMPLQSSGKARVCAVVFLTSSRW